MYNCPYFLRGARAEPLQQPAQDHPIFQGGLQKRFRIRDGLLRRLQHPERNQPCNRLFRRIHVQSQRILFNKAAALGFSTALLLRSRCHLCVTAGTRLIPKNDAWSERDTEKGAAGNPPPQVGCGCEIQQVWFPPLDGACFFFFPPPSLSNLASCQVRFAVMR